MADKDNDPSMRALYALTGIIGAVWIASLVVDMVNPGYDPPANLGLVFMSVVSALIGVITAARARGDGSKQDDENKDGKA